MPDVRHDIARELLEIGAVTFRPEAPFTWASGIESPIYTDNRLTLGYPDLRRRLAAAFAEQMEARAFAADVIAGTATAGIPHATLLADRLDLPLVYVRGKPKEHGRGNQIEGPLSRGQRVVVVEDLVSTGGSSLDAAAALRSAGAVVTGVVAIFSYNLKKAREAFAAAGVTTATLTDFDALVEVASQTGHLPPDQRGAMLAWRDTLSKQF